MTKPKKVFNTPSTVCFCRGSSAELSRLKSADVFHFLPAIDRFYRIITIESGLKVNLSYPSLPEKYKSQRVFLLVQLVDPLSKSNND